MAISSVILQTMNLCSYLTRVEDMQSQGRGDGIILKTEYFLGKYTDSGDWQCYIWGRCSCIGHTKDRFTHSMPCPCCAHAVPLTCRAAKSLECVFPIWFTQCGRVWFTLAMPCHSPTMPFFSRPQYNTAVERRPCCVVALRKTSWSEHGKCESDRAALCKSNGKDTF